VAVHLDLFQSIAMIATTSDTWGQAQLDATLPPGTEGQAIAVQAFWFPAPGCPMVAVLSASEGLELSIY